MQRVDTQWILLQHINNVGASTYWHGLLCSCDFYGITLVHGGYCTRLERE